MWFIQVQVGKFFKNLGGHHFLVSGRLGRPRGPETTLKASTTHQVDQNVTQARWGNNNSEKLLQ